MKTQRLKGSQLSASEQNRAKAMFVHRYTMDNKPAWAAKPRENGAPYKPQYKSDQEWLENTYFQVTKDGRISDVAAFCESTGATWPQGK